MDGEDPRSQLDPFTALLVEQLRFEAEITAKSLINLQPDMALAQLGLLRKRALDRIKNWHFELETDLSVLGANGVSEQDVLKVMSIVVAAVEETFENVRRHIEACDESIYGPKDDDAPEAGDV